MSNTRSDFEQHWGTNFTSVNAAKLEEARDFLKPLLSWLSEKNDVVDILDVGCGDGIHSFILAEENCNFAGLDIASTAVSIAKSRFPQEANGDFLVADALTLPYADNSFDAVFSYGVVAYTADPKQAIKELARVIKPGGLAGVWIYPKPEGLANVLLTFTRTVSRILGRRLARLLVTYPIVLIMPILPIQSGVSLANSSWQQCVEVVEVNIMPQQLIFPTVEDVEAWFKSHNLDIAINDESRPISIWGYKP